MQVELVDFRVLMSECNEDIIETDTLSKLEELYMRHIDKCNHNGWSCVVINLINYKAASIIIPKLMQREEELDKEQGIDKYMVYQITNLQQNLESIVSKHNLKPRKAYDDRVPSDAPTKEALLELGNLYDSICEAAIEWTSLLEIMNRKSQILPNIHADGRHGKFVELATDVCSYMEDICPICIEFTNVGPDYYFESTLLVCGHVIHTHCSETHRCYQVRTNHVGSNDDNMIHHQCPVCRSPFRACLYDLKGPYCANDWLCFIRP